MQCRPPPAPHPNNSLSSILFRLFIRQTQRGGVTAAMRAAEAQGDSVCCRDDGLCAPRA